MKKMLIIILLFVTIIFACLPTGFSAFADGDSDSPVFDSNVLDDLTGSTIDGKVFSLSDYPFVESGELELISFIEYCYSFSSEKSADYSLYAIVYNPRGLAFDDDARNEIQFAYGTNGYTGYQLSAVNYSTEAGYEGLFYKFKVNLTDTERQTILDGLTQDQRIYNISGIELSVGGTVTEYAIGRTYTYSGYALGYGSSLAAESTLVCEVDGIKNVLSLDVHSTYYRPEGTNGGLYTQDTLHSVYFSVPNELIQEYGEMTAVHATWLNAVTNPVFVTGNSDVYNAVVSYLGSYVDGGDYTFVRNDNSNNELLYSLIASKRVESASWDGTACNQSYISYNANRYFGDADFDLYYLAYCFLADNGDADNYTISSEKILEWFDTYTYQHGGELVNNEYSRALFSCVADTVTDITISADDTYKLTDEIISQSFWQKFVGGGYSVTGANDYVISAIKKVTASDILSTPTAVCNALYVDASDYDEFISFYGTSQTANESVYLFRYYQSDYTIYEVVEYERGHDLSIFRNFEYNYVDTNAYFMKMSVQLGFDVIDLTFTKNDVLTVIPVVMSPQNMVADGDSPVITNPDIDDFWAWLKMRLEGSDLLKMIIGIVLVLILLMVLGPVLPLVFRFIWFVVTLPFKILGGFFKMIGRAARARKE